MGAQWKAKHKDLAANAKGRLFGKLAKGIETLRACSTTSRSRELAAGSAPWRAAIMMSLASLPNSLPLALAARSLCFAFHCAPFADAPLC